MSLESLTDLFSENSMSGIFAQIQGLFAQDYGAAYALVILFLLLGACAIGIPRFRKIDPLAKDKKKTKRRR